eukprot:gene42217-56074_t
MADRVSITIKSPEEGRELFLLKFQGEVSREHINDLMLNFKRHNISKNPNSYLTENEALLLFESRGEPKTATELRSLLSAMGNDKSYLLNFLEFLCIIYKKKYTEVNSFLNDESRLVVAKEAQAAVEAAKKIEQ